MADHKKPTSSSGEIEAMARVLISHTHGDSFFARRIRALLSQYGFDVWLDTSADLDFYFHNTLTHAPQRADAIVVLVSPRFEHSDWIELELEYAQEAGQRIIPVLIDGAEEHASAWSAWLDEAVHVGVQRRDYWVELIGDLVAKLSGATREDRLVPCQTSAFDIAFNSASEDISAEVLNWGSVRDHFDAVAADFDHAQGSLALFDKMQLARSRPKAVEVRDLSFELDSSGDADARQAVAMDAAVATTTGFSLWRPIFPSIDMLGVNAFTRTRALRYSALGYWMDYVQSAERDYRIFWAPHHCVAASEAPAESYIAKVQSTCSDRHLRRCSHARGLIVNWLGQPLGAGELPDCSAVGQELSAAPMGLRQLHSISFGVFDDLHELVEKFKEQRSAVKSWQCAGWQVGTVCVSLKADHGVLPDLSEAVEISAAMLLGEPPVPMCRESSSAPDLDTQANNETLIRFGHVACKVARGGSKQAACGN